jgi:hypothetical protein
MHTAQFIKFVTVAGWLWVSQGNLVRSEQVGLIAQVPTCNVDKLSAPDGLSTTIGTPPTGLSGRISISITCPSGVGGNLRLILNPMVVNNGGAKMKFASGSGALNGVSTSDSTGTIDVVIPAATGNRTGTGSIQVDIANTSGKLLKSANNYNLIVTADFN